MYHKIFVLQCKQNLYNFASGIPRTLYSTQSEPHVAHAYTIIAVNHQFSNCTELPPPNTVDHPLSKPLCF